MLLLTYGISLEKSSFKFTYYKNPECEVRIEKSATRITVWYHEACQLMTKGDL